MLQSAECSATVFTQWHASPENQWFHEEFLQPLFQRKQDEMQLVMDFFNLKLTVP
jgi:hypothetical protein